MMMYHVSEQLILESWALETLVVKVRHGFAFEMSKRGIVMEDEKQKTGGDCVDDVELMNLYS